MKSTKKYNKNISKIILIIFLFSLCFLNTTALAVEENNKITVKKSSKIEKTQKTEEKEKLDDSKENAIENNKNDTKIETKTKENQDEAKKLEEKPKTKNTDNTKNYEIEKQKESKNTQNAQNLQNTKLLNTNNTSNKNNTNSEGNNINNENTNQAFEAKLNEIIFKRAGANDYIIGNISTNKKFEDVTIVVREKISKKELEVWKLDKGSGNIYIDRNMTNYEGEYEIVAKYKNEEKVLDLTNVKKQSNTYKTVELKNIFKNSFVLRKIKEPVFLVRTNELTFVRAGENDYILGNIYTNKKCEDVTVVVREKVTKKELGVWKLDNGSGNIYFDRNMTNYEGEYEIVAKYKNEEKVLDLTNVKNKSNTYETVELKNMFKNSFVFSKKIRKIKLKVKDITVKKIGKKDYLISNLYVKDYNLGYKIYLKNIADGTLHETWMLKNGTDCYFDKNLTGFTGEFEIIIKSGDGKEDFISLNNWKNDMELNTFNIEKNNKTFILKPFTKEYIVETKDITFKNVNSLDYLMGNIDVYNKVGTNIYDAGKVNVVIRDVEDKTIRNTWILKRNNNTYYFDINLSNKYGKYEIVLFNLDTNIETIIPLNNVCNYKNYNSVSVEILDQKRFELTKPKKEIFGKINEGKFTSTENADYFIGTINAYSIYKGAITKLNDYNFAFKDINTKKEYKMFVIDRGNNNYYVDLNLSNIPTGNYNIILKDGTFKTDIIITNVKVENLQTIIASKLDNGYTLKRKSEDLYVFLKNTKFKAISERDYIQADLEVYLLDNGIKKNAKDKFDIGVKNLRTGKITRGYIKNIKDNIYYMDININYADEGIYSLIAINKENQKEINLNIRFDKTYLFLHNNKIYDIINSNFKIKRLKPYTLNITNYWANSNNYTKEGGRIITEITIHHMAMVGSAEKCGGIFQNPNRKASSNYGIGVNGEVGRYVADTDISWANANWESNKRAITIEVSDESIGGRWPVSNASMNTLIELIAQIARRYEINLVKGVTLTWHRMYYNTNCPGPYLLEHMDYIIEEARKEYSTIKEINRR